MLGYTVSYLQVIWVCSETPLHTYRTTLFIYKIVLQITAGKWNWVAARQWRVACRAHVNQSGCWVKVVSITEGLLMCDDLEKCKLVRHTAFNLSLLDVRWFYLLHRFLFLSSFRILEELSSASKTINLFIVSCLLADVRDLMSLYLTVIWDWCFVI